MCVEITGLTSGRSRSVGRKDQGGESERLRNSSYTRGSAYKMSVVFGFFGGAFVSSAF